MQDLDKFKNEMNLSGKNVYVGHRYKPKMFGEWNNTQIYEPLSIVQYQGNSYTSRQYVPAGIEITNEEYWSSTGNYNAQIEQYRQDVRNLGNDVTTLNNEVIKARNGELTLSERLEKEHQEVTNQLTQIVYDNPVTPEQFQGTDYDKLQSAFNLAITENRPLKISRVYDIAENTIMINKRSDYRFPTYVFGGGAIKKTQNGYMFDTPNTSVSDLIFNNIFFYGEENLDVDFMNCSGVRIIRVKTNQCYFRGFRNIYFSNSYLQDIHSNLDTIVRNKGTFFQSRGGFFVSVNKLTMENSSGYVVNQEGTDDTYTFNYNYVFKDSIIEGFTGDKPLFNIRSGNLTLDSVYFEVVPNGVIKQLGGELTVNIKDVTWLGATNDVPFLTTNKIANGTIEKVISPISPLVDATLLETGFIELSDIKPVASLIDPNKRLINKDTMKTFDSGNKIKSTYKHFSISKTGVDVNGVDVLRIRPTLNTGGVVIFTGGGLQGNKGVFGTGKTFNYIRTSTEVTIVDSGSSHGQSVNQHDQIVARFTENGDIIFTLKSDTSLASANYDLDVEIKGATSDTEIDLY